MIKLTLVTPEKKLLIGQEVESVIVPAYKGELNILAGHSPLVTTLETGIVRWKLKDKSEYEKAVISSGYCEVFPDASVDILAEIADLPSEIDIQECKDNLSESEQKALNSILSDEEFESVTKDIARLQADLEMMRMS